MMNLPVEGLTGYFDRSGLFLWCKRCDIVLTIKKIYVNIDTVNERQIEYGLGQVS